MARRVVLRAEDDQPRTGTTSVESSFAQFYDAHYVPVWRALTMTLGDAELAADSTQEAMLRAYERFGEMSAVTNPAGWVYRVGLNAARSRLRGLRRELLGLVRDRPVTDEHPPTPGVVAALRELPVEQRAVVVLRFYLDMTAEQVAETLEIPVGTVKSRQHRGLDRLRDRLEGQP